MIRNDKPYSVQVRQRGQVTIPQKLRDSLKIAEGDTLMIVPVGDTLLLVPRQLRVPELSNQIVTLMDEAGLSLADMLDGLPRIREDLYRDRYETGREA